MKRRHKHIILSWILLLCFVTGQYVVYAHQHKTKTISVFGSKDHKQKRQVKEKCDLCDAMHHTYVDMTVKVYLPSPTVISYSYHCADDCVTSISLVLSKGRSPPLS